MFLLVVAFAQIVEGVGAFGWDDSERLIERPWLTFVHDVALTGPAVALAAALVVGLVAAVRRRRSLTNPTA